MKYEQAEKDYLNHGSYITDDDDSVCEGCGTRVSEGCLYYEPTIDKEICSECVDTLDELY